MARPRHKRRGACRPVRRASSFVVTDRTHRVRDLNVLRRIGGAKVLPGLEQQHAV
jgi:hypothetical protein